MRGIYARRSKALIRALKEHLHNEVEIFPPALGLHLCALARPTSGSARVAMPANAASATKPHTKSNTMSGAWT